MSIAGVSSNCLEQKGLENTLQQPLLVKQIMNVEQTYAEDRFLHVS